MASITFNSLKNTTVTQDKYTYADLALDLQLDLTGASNLVTTNGTSRDIKVAYDLNAIRNSIQNIFNTVPGERFLLPTFGADLRSFVFEPMTQITGSAIARVIQYSINNWEPRCRILSLDVQGFEDRNEYDITLTLQVPFLSQPLNLQGTLSQQGFSF